MGQLYHFLMGSSREKVGGSRTGNRTRFAFSFPLGKMQLPSSPANLLLPANPEDAPCRQPDSICIFFPLGKENNGVVPVEPGTSGSPPDCRIQMGSSPVPVTSKKAPHSGNVIKLVTLLQRWHPKRTSASVSGCTFSVKRA